MRKLFFLCLHALFLSLSGGNYEPSDPGSSSLLHYDIITSDGQHLHNTQPLSSCLPAIPLRQKDITLTYDIFCNGSIINVQLNEPYCKIAAAYCHKECTKNTRKALQNELEWACTKPSITHQERRIKIAKALICGANPRLMCFSDKNLHPLYIALQNDDPQLAWLALENGAPIQNKATKKPTISFAKTVVLARMLKDYGALAKHNSDFFHEHLFTLTLPQYPADLLAFFIENKFPVHARNSYNYTPLMRLMSRAYWYTDQENALIKKADYLLAQYNMDQIQHTVSLQNPAFRKLVHYGYTMPSKVLIDHLVHRLAKAVQSPDNIAASSPYTYASPTPENIDTLAAYVPPILLRTLTDQAHGFIASRSNSRYTFVQQ